MEIFFNCLKAFLVGGLICTVGQILIDKTKLTPARILVAFLLFGVVLNIFGVYQYLVDWGGAGATVPISGFGNTLAEGAKKAVSEEGFIGIFTGGLGATAAGITASILFGYIFSLIFKTRPK